MNIETPKNWRKGQTLFNFLWWLHTDKGYAVEPGALGRMGDPFHISDVQLDTYYREFLTEKGL